ncbi:hypothetical protein EG329_002914 [Mollisiaceae sp. DMI_Dod_QoI]|nr:hypothetical protein EG329_002914 [Helotiales sp. DMI_Dod_QoI]
MTSSPQDHPKRTLFLNTSPQDLQVLEKTIKLEIRPPTTQEVHDPPHGSTPQQHPPDPFYGA